MKKILESKTLMLFYIFTVSLYAFYSLYIDMQYFTSSIEGLPWYEPCGMKWLAIPIIVFIKGLFLFLLLNLRSLNKNPKFNTIFALFPLFFMIIGYILGNVDSLFREDQTHTEFFTYVEVLGSIGVFLAFLFLFKFIYDETKIIKIS